MEIIRTISLYVEDKDKQFLIIGGHAVNAYGISRQTGDLDLLVRGSDKEFWEALLGKLNYKCDQNDHRFARFQPSSLTEWPIDLMFVDDKTFRKMYDQSKETNMGQCNAQVVSARHLATLKIHALKNYQSHRHAKDYNDLLSLIRSGATGLKDSELEELCKAYATQALLDKLKSDLE